MVGRSDHTVRPPPSSVSDPPKPLFKPAATFADVSRPYWAITELMLRNTGDSP
jgi:hypothetical protein